MLAKKIGSTLLRNLPNYGCLASSRQIQIWKPEEPFTNVSMPEKYRLPVTPKVPLDIQMGPGKVHRGTRENWRILGEERIHNKLVLGQFGIVAIHGGWMEQRHFEMLRGKFNRYLKEGKSFAIYRVDSPYKPWVKRGTGKALGGGKASIDHYRTPVKAGRVICEVGGKCYWEEISPWLKRFAAILPFEAIAVNPEILKKLNDEEDRLKNLNSNPISFEWLVRNNMFDCGRFLSPYDQKWFGKFIYRDRHLNKKWNEVRQSPYKSMN